MAAEILSSDRRRGLTAVFVDDGWLIVLKESLDSLVNDEVEDLACEEVGAISQTLAQHNA